MLVHVFVYVYVILETSQLRESLRETRKQLEAVTTERNDLDSKRKKQDEEISQIKKYERVCVIARASCAGLSCYTWFVLHAGPIES